jgi:hypothetical protein
VNLSPSTAGNTSDTGAGLRGFSRGSIPLRLGLIGTGLLVLRTATLLWAQTGYFWKLGNFALSALAWAFGVVCLVFGVLDCLPRASQWLVLAGLVGSLWASAYILWRISTPSTVWHPDNEMIGEYAAEALSQGYNPYSWNFSDATRVYRDPGDLTTYFLDGSKQNRVTYPALPTLLLLALGSIGLGQARLVSLIFHSILLIIVFLGMPSRIRPLLVVSLFSVEGFIGLALIGFQDIVWSTLLVAMLLAWRRPTLRAVLFGLACAYRQQSWIVAPFLLIYLWNTEGSGAERRSRILHFVAVSLGTFLLINLPFILWDARGWVLGALEPAYAAFDVYSQGLGIISQYNLLGVPRQVFTALEISSLLLMLLIHWRHPGWVGTAFWIFPGIFFWLHYRGLANYWLYWIPPLVIALTRHRWSGLQRIDMPGRWRQTLVVAATVLSADVLLAAFFLIRPPAVSASLIYPLQSWYSPGIHRLVVTVKNQSDRLFRPRFAVQHDGSVATPWFIESGPEILRPGESARYSVSSFSHPFSAASGGQLVITDAGKDYALRVVTDIAGDHTFTSPDLIVNPSFAVWQLNSQTPAAWSAQGDNPSIETESVDGRRAVVLSAIDGSTRLSQTVTLPVAFFISVYPTIESTDPLGSVQGMELDDGLHVLRVLFGRAEKQGLLEENVAYVYQRAPLNEWSRHEIKPSELYASFGWELPPYTVRDSQGLEFSARQVKLSLLVSGSKVIGTFGSIEQDLRLASADSLVAAAIERPDVYYVNLGNEYWRQRNYGLAEDAYRQAIAYNEANAYAHNGLGRTLADEGRCVEAQQQLDAAIQLDLGFQDPFGEILTCR